MPQRADEGPGGELDLGADPPAAGPADAGPGPEDGVRQRAVAFGRYLLDARVGEGALTEAFLAKSHGVEGFAKDVFVKRLRISHEANPGVVEGFIREARRAVTLSHALVAQVIDLGVAEDEAGKQRHFVVTEAVRGVDLGRWTTLAQAGRQAPLGVALQIVAEVARVLDHAHRKRFEGKPIALGGLTPRAVLVTDEGQVKVTDACLGAALLADGVPVEASAGLLAFRAPEERSGVASPRGDLWSLGALLFSLLVGAPPPEDAASAALAARPELAAPVVEALASLLSVDPRRRGEDAASWHERLLGLAYAVGGERDPAWLAREVRVVAAVSTVSPKTPPPPVVEGEAREGTLLVVAGEGALTTVALVERRGARVVEATPERVVAAFGLSEPDGRDAEAAVDAGLAILGVASTLALGVDVGRIPCRGDEPVEGTALRQLVARADAQRESGVGTLGVSRRVAALVRGSHLLAEGQRGPGQRTVVGVRARAAGATRFVGRGAELRRLAASFAEVEGGAVGFVRVVGAPGVGKTRLLGEIERRLVRARSEATFVLATVGRRTAGEPFAGLVAAALASVGLPMHPSEVDGAAAERFDERLRSLGLDGADVAALRRSGGLASSDVAGAFGRLVARLTREHPLVVVWDDADALDKESVRAIEGLVAAATPRALFVLLARERSLPVGGPLVDLELPELSSAETAALVTSIVGARMIPPEAFRHLDERAGGNPRLVEELVRELLDRAALVVEDGIVRIRVEGLDALPRTLRAVGEARLARLSPVARDLVRASAVLDASASPELLARLADVPEGELAAALDEAVAARALERVERVEGGDDYAAARIVADVALLALPHEELERLHDRAGASVEQGATASGAALATLASHAEAAGRVDRAFALHARAARAARGEGAFDRAVAHAARALSVTTEATAPEVLGLLGDVAALAERVGELPELADALPGALEALDTARPDDGGRARLLAARALAAGGAYEQASVLLTGAAERGVDETELLGARILTARLSGDVVRGLEAAEALRASGGGDARTWIHVAALEAAADRLGAAFTSIERAAGLASDAATRTLVEIERGGVRVWAGDPTGALPLLERALESARDQELPVERALALVAIGRAHLAHDDRGRAYGAFSAARDESQAVGLARAALVAAGHVAYLDGLSGREPGELAASIARAEASGYLAEALELGVLAAEAAPSARAALEVLEARARSAGHLRVAARARAGVARASR